MSKNRSPIRFIILGFALIAISSFFITAENRWSGNVLSEFFGIATASATTANIAELPGIAKPNSDEAIASPNLTNGNIVFHRGLLAPQTIFMVDPAAPGGEFQIGPGAYPVWKPDGSAILFTVPDTGELKLMNPDGSNVRSLATAAFASASVENAAWSSDGTKIAFVKAGDIWIMNADGSGQTRRTNATHEDSGPTMSPDGTRIAFQRGNFAAQIYTVTTTNPVVETNLTNLPNTNNRAPNWSPDGTKIAIETDRDTVLVGRRPEIYILNSQTGAVLQRMTNDNYDDHDPAFSPTGTHIVWQSGSRPGVSNNKLFVMPSTANPATAAQQTLITAGTIMDLSPSWGPGLGSCSLTPTPTTTTLGPSGGVVTFEVRVSTQNCKWGPSVNIGYLPFVHIQDRSLRTGDGTVTFSVDPNPGPGRVSQIEFYADGRSFPNIFKVLQVDSQNCYYSSTPIYKSYERSAGAGEITVSAPSGCSWTATTDDSWIHLQQPLAGTGTGRVNFTIDENPALFGADRTGDVTINGQVAGIHQVGVEFESCSLDRAAPDQATVDSLHTFRDEILRPTRVGQQYIYNYYEYTGEITRLMIFNPGLFARSVEALARYKIVVDSVVGRERAVQRLSHGITADTNEAAMEPVVVTDAEIEDVDEILAGYSALGSEALRNKLEGVRRDLRDANFRAEFGVEIRPGPRRAIPEGALSSVAKRILPVSFFSGASFDPFSQGTVQFATAKRKPLPALDTKAVSESRVSLPLSFEANRGQVDQNVKFVARGLGYDLYFTPSAAVVSLPIRSGEELPNDQNFLPPVLAKGIQHQAIGRRNIELKLDGADFDSPVVGLNEMPNKSNYFIGRDPAKWKTDIPNFNRVRYDNVYPGIDLDYYGNQRQLEYDFRVAAGADPAIIGLDVAGADAVEIDDAGDLVLHSRAGDIQMLAPITYQVINGVRHEITSRYVLKDKDPGGESAVSMVGFEIGDYDRGEPLVIDPVLVYSTYLGGGGEDSASSVAVDATGNSYLIGFTGSTNFPVVGAIQATNGGGPHDVVVSKINPAGTGLVYSTYIGGNGQDQGSDIAIDAGGNAYISGWSGSANFPTTVGAMQRTRTGFYNAFVAKLNPTGSALVYSTYFGGTTGEFGSSIAIDANGNAFVGGVTSSPDMPKLNPFQTSYGGDLADAFVAKINATGSALSYATYLGGNGNDGITDIAVDSNGSVYATGVTYSTNYPTKTAQQVEFKGGAFDAFVSKFDPSGTTVSYSTYLGGSNDDRGYRVRVDSTGNAYVAGQTSSPNFPVSSALQSTYGGGVNDAFLTKVGPTGAILTSTYLGGGGDDGATGLAIDTSGNAYLTGFSGSTNFPLTRPIQLQNNGGTWDGFLTKINAAGTGISYSTFLGGTGADSGFDVALGTGGDAYVFGVTASTNFPTVNPFQATNGGGASDLFIARIADTAPTVTVSGRVLTPGSLGLRNAVVVLTDSQGARRTATTSSFGVYSFGNVTPGETYTIGVSSKRYRFSSRSLLISDNLTNVDFVGLE